ncbi:hypothetical protein, partial [Klebsiella variicola]|uniref:hypothetical protein n=1 Tax=Klebsiella variicola TaxID=244366 RepID=UPI001D00F151
RAASTTFPDAPNPPLLLLSLSCGTCLAERKDAPAGAKKARGVGGQQAQHFLMRPTPRCHFCPCPAALALLKECSLRGQKKARGVGGQQAKRND